MLEETDKRPLIGNLYGAVGNPRAREALIRRPESATALRPQFLGASAPSANGPASFADVMESQGPDRIIGDVLEGPVSQQTQRQLAQIQAMSQRQSSAWEEELVASARTSSPQAASAPVRRGARTLLAGATVLKGVGTGSVFNAARMAAYRQKQGYALRLPDRRNSDAELVSEARKIQETDGSNSLGGMAQSARAAFAESFAAEGADGGIDESAPKESKFEAIINRAAKALGLDPNLIRAVIKAESNFNPKAVSSAGAKGLMQLMPRTAKEMGVSDPFDPLENVWGGARYLKSMLDRHGGNVNKALAAYNWGPGNLDRHGYGGNMPRETRRYIDVVNRNYQEFKKATVSAEA
ncbi:MAG: lytic transglycosylase domain-containing protein [Deltaproteobacteria bacterium]|jgi:soluble lytic murein transglycosylase-like protein|nr:lytic transglycosylase domain-containing protein [Deltaproteobacteria bacterium]